MTSSARAALLIDADNFNDPDQLRAVHSQFTQRVGKGFVCHAHGAISVWQRAGFKDALADIGGRFMPGLPLDKNTTDANLIIDALMLHFQQGVRRFGIASGDADFAPLAVQLRELGCDVAGYARYAIAFERMVNYFDSVVRFDSPPAIRVVPKVMPASAVAQSSIAESVQAQQNLPPLEPLAKPAISSANSVSDKPTRIARARAMRAPRSALLPSRNSTNSAEPRLMTINNRNRMTTKRMTDLLGRALKFSCSPAPHQRHLEQV